MAERQQKCVLSVKNFVREKEKQVVGNDLALAPTERKELLPISSAIGRNYQEKFFVPAYIMDLPHSGLGSSIWKK